VPAQPPKRVRCAARKRLPDKETQRIISTVTVRLPTLLGAASAHCTVNVQAPNRRRAAVGRSDAARIARMPSRPHASCAPCSGLIRLATALVAIAALVHGAHATAQTGRWPAELHAALQSTGIPRESVALYVQEVGASAPLLEWNADRAMNPASTMKLVTTLAALEVLGPGYTWRTEVYAHGPVQDGVLNGNLVLKGYGDPKLNLENFWLLLADVRARGVREVRGDVLLDRSFFALPPGDPSRFDGEPTRPYNVEPDALLVNFKSIRLQVIPDEAAGRVRIVATPALPEVEVVNQMALAPASCETWPEKPQYTLDPPRLVFIGVFPAGCGERSRYFAMLDPNRYAQSLFLQTWRALGGTLTGSVREGALPANATLLASQESPPLSEVIRDINKFSINVMARHVFLTLGLAAQAPPLVPAAGARATAEWLKRAGIDAPEAVLENGAGLSRVERISARTLAKVLLRGFAGPLMPEYVASLPIVGVDGTLRRRLNGSPASGQAHIKTGYLEGVRAIAGYVLDRNGRWLALVAIINHPNAVNGAGFQDAMIDWAYLQAVVSGAGCQPGKRCRD
jgi:D-alanyl-D-alanine carboxypeptidase/D-alanyl-D-alanine-endopeptidase (penicillin-binding protein 4)